MAKKKETGRPTKYEERFDRIAEDFLSTGKSVTQLARHINVAKSTLYEWAKHSESFSNALKVGAEFSQAVWEDKLEEMMYDKEVNSPLVKLYFANRFRWHDRPEEAKQEHKPISINIIAPE